MHAGHSQYASKLGWLLPFDTHVQLCAFETNELSNSLQGGGRDACPRKWGNQKKA